MGCRNVAVKRNAACDSSCFQERICDSCAIERKASLIVLWCAIMQHEKLDCAINGWLRLEIGGSKPTLRECVIDY